jgi:diguanylate cyclase (GGDEF)-like protein
MFLDLDNFKILNDTYGHNLGDVLLVEASSRLKYVIGHSHTVARFGGDEFVIIINELSKDHLIAAQQAIDWATQLHASLNQAFYLQSPGVSGHPDTTIEHQLTASIGITLFNGTQRLEVDELLKLADLALYRAKTDGRNKTVVFDPSMQEDLIQSQKIQTHFSKAIKNNQFELFYQPQLNDHNQLIGLEALVRWPQSNNSTDQTHFISPAEFIPMAEETGLIIPLGDWVLNQACKQIAQWQDHSILGQLVVSVNISAKQLSQTDFIQQVCKVVKTYGIKPNQLKLEITESVLLQDVTDTIEKLHQLKERGIKISLDDFGTGYSSLSYLKRLPVDEIKIDQSFVRDLMTDESDAIMIKAIIDLSKNFAINVIAEGVETAEQRDQLIKFGCHDFQGYFFAKPLSLEQLNNWLTYKD